MGGKSGGGARTPYEAPNTLSSAQNLRIVDAIAEGVLAGFAFGDDAPFKSVHFNDTPVQNPDGSFNFKGVTGYFNRGTPDQTYIPGFDATERTVAVSSAVKQATPIVRAVTDNLVNRLRVTVGVERNVQVKSNGDSVATNTTLRVELVGASGVEAARTVTFREKGSSAFYHDVVFDKLPPVPFNVRVTRTTADSATDKVSNNTFFASYVEIIDAKLSYPHVALAALKIDSDQFGNQVPRRNYLLKGKIVAVPSNYDPIARTYTGFWDGSFKQAWTNNPAWVFYDLVTQPRYSTLARRLNVADIDKMSLYAVAQYCDKMVQDGFGGQEPRFVCNAYITEQRQAGELLTDLASVFTGLPIWNGNQVSVVVDTDADPVTQYTNSSVVDGAFTYSSAALKSIHTAVHVRYLDKYDGYRSKTEYVADDEAIKHYGLNIKSVTAFGCDSRGQAARFGAWILQTELRQQNAVSFAVGREGLKHLPYDIIQIADNHYAGTQMAGRVLTVSGSLITLDRDVTDAVGSQLQYVVPEVKDGATRAVFKSLRVTAQPKPNQLWLESAPALTELDNWVLSGKVKPRLYRVISIAENTEEGTYTVSALLHDPKKYAAVDGYAKFDRDVTTLHNSEPVLTNGNVGSEGSAVVITWDNLSADGTVLTYDIKILRDGKLYRHIDDAASPEIRLENLPNGNYVAEIRGRNARGVLSAPLVKAWSINYTITGLRATPKLFAIGLTWTLPEPVVRAVHTEIWYGTENDINKAAKLAALPYPQNEYTLTGVKISDRYYFWARIVDDGGISGEYTASVAGVCDTDPAPIITQITGAITESTLSRELIDQLDGKIAAGDSKTAADAAAALQKEAQARAAALTAEAAARTAAVNKEINDRVADVNAARSKAAGDLTAKAAELGNKITAVENVNNQQAQQINTVTAAQGVTAAGLETEKKARADGDAAEAAARTTLAARVTTAEGSITRNDGLRVTGDKANADAIAAMGVRVGSAESGITNLQQTVAGNQAATATAITTLQASVGAGANLMQDSEFKYGFTYLRANATSGDVTIGMNHAAYPVAGRNILFMRRAFVDTNSRVVILQRMAIQRGKIYQVAADCYQKGGASTGCKIYVRPVDATGAWNTTGVQIRNVGAAAVHDSRPFEYGHFVRSGDNISIDAASPVTQIDIAFSVRETTDTAVLVQLLTNPMICEVASIDAPLVPYSPGADPLIGISEAGFNEYKQAQATVDAAQTTELNAAKSSIAGNTAKVTALETTVANNQTATATRISAVEASLGTSANLIPDSEFNNGFREHLASEVQQPDYRLGFNMSPMRSIPGTNVGYLHRQRIETDNRNLELYRIPAEPGKTYQMSCYMQFVTANVSATSLYARPLVGGLWDSTGMSSRVVQFAPVPARVDGATTLASMHRVVINVRLAPDAPTEQLGFAMNFGTTSDANNAFQFFCRPMLCEVANLDAPPVPYTPGPSGSAMAARVTAAETAIVANNSAMASRVSTVETQTGQNTASITSTSNAVTSLTGKVSALHTVKVEAISGGRKVVAGTALGVDGATGDSQFLVYADKFGMVNPSSEQIDTPFVINNTAGGAKMALKGDFVASGTILGSHIAANQTIQAPNILGGSLNIGGGRFTVNGAGQVNIAAQSGNVGLKITNERIEVYDESGVLRVRLGKLV